MPSAYSIVEPHPSPAMQGYIPTGRGGAGNLTKPPRDITQGTNAAGPAARASITSLSTASSTRKSFASGRGGFGNVHPPSERAIFSFDEELEAQLRQERDVAPVYHVGRGGAGNTTRSEQQEAAASRAFSDAGARRSSNWSGTSGSSCESGADVATRGLKKGWKKIAGMVA